MSTSEDLPLKLRRIISGGQTGADRGGLEAAIKLGLEYGGVIPRGRGAEDGQVPAKYSNMLEAQTTSYTTRTLANVLTSHATIVFTLGSTLSPGSRRTLRLCEQHQRPSFWLNLEDAETTKALKLAQNEFLDFLRDESVEILNVAGSRESKAPGIEARVERFLMWTLKGKIHV